MLKKWITFDSIFVSVLNGCFHSPVNRMIEKCFRVVPKTTVKGRRVRLRRLLPGEHTPRVAGDSAQRLPASWPGRGEPLPRVSLKDTFCPAKVKPNSGWERAPQQCDNEGAKSEVHGSLAGLTATPTVILGRIAKVP